MNETGTAAHAGMLAARSHPAAMIVLSDPDDPATAQVRVVNARCGLDQTVEFLRTEIRRS